MTPMTRNLGMAIAAVLGIGAASAVVLGGVHVTRTVTIPGGTTLVAALRHGVSTEDSRPGDPVELRTVEPIRIGRGLEVPAGVIIHGTITESKGGGRIAGAPQLAIRFSDIESAGDRHPLDAEPFRVTGRSDAGKSALQIGGGTVGGAILGRLVGGRGGTATGAVMGAAVGTGVAVATRGGQLALPAGQKVRILLSGPVTITYRPLEHPERTASR